VTTITDIRRCGPAFRRRTIVLDGDPWRDVPAVVLAALGVEVSDEVDFDDLEQRVGDIERKLVRERALYLLTSRERSRAQLRGRLVEDGFASDVAAEVVQDFARLGLVDDERFAQALARTLAHARGTGRAGIARELRTAGVADEIAEAALEEALGADDEMTAARRLADSAAAKPGATLDKVVQRLARRGYRLTVALAAAREAWEAADRAAPADAPASDPFDD
jgi:regulatory protein